MNLTKVRSPTGFEAVIGILFGEKTAVPTAGTVDVPILFVHRFFGYFLLHPMTIE